MRLLFEGGVLLSGFFGWPFFCTGFAVNFDGERDLDECGMGPGPETAVAVLRCIGLVEAYAPPLGRMFSAFFPVLLRASAPRCRSWHLRDVSARQGYMAVGRSQRAYGVRLSVRGAIPRRFSVGVCT